MQSHDTLPLDAEPEIELNPDPEPEVALEPDPEPEIELDPESDPGPVPESELPPAAVTTTALMEILPADFPLPLLTKFVPNTALRVACDEAVAYALQLDIKEKAGCERADLALTTVRNAIKAIEAEFKEPTEIAHRLHSRLTTLRGEWIAPAQTAVKTVGGRVGLELRRLDELDKAEKRKAQEKADQEAREAARKEAEAAEKAKAPVQVVEELKRQAAQATAPPVASTSYNMPAMRGSAPIAPWKARITGTPACDEPNPDMVNLSPAQRLQIFTTLQAILEGKAPLNAIEINWSYINSRAKADKATFQIVGFESWEDVGVRARPTRAAK